MKTMTGITWGEDRIYTLVTREFPEEGDEPEQAPAIETKVLVLPEDMPTPLDMGISESKIQAEAPVELPASETKELVEAGNLG